MGLLSYHAERGFHRAALQVNPYEYLVRFNKISKYDNESDYNKAIVDPARLMGSK